MMHMLQCSTTRLLLFTETHCSSITPLLLFLCSDSSRAIVVLVDHIPAIEAELVTVYLIIKQVFVVQKCNDHCIAELRTFVYIKIAI